MTLVALVGLVLCSSAAVADVGEVWNHQELEVAGQFEFISPAVGIDRSFQLSRVIWTSTLQQGPALARLELGAVRSGGSDSYIGVAGESIVMQVRIAEAQWRPDSIHAEAAAGLVEDLWVAEANTVWDFRSLSPSVGEYEGWMERSDLGMRAQLGLLNNRLQGGVSMTSGEGLANRERNAGQNAAAILRWVQPMGADGDDSLRLSVYGRNGSRGLSFARDHRVGGILSADVSGMNLGAGALKAWGVDGDAESQPMTVSIWASGRSNWLVMPFLRLDRAVDPQVEASVFLRALGGVNLPISKGVHGRFFYEESRAQEGAQAIRGANALSFQRRIGVELHSKLTFNP